MPYFTDWIRSTDLSCSLIQRDKDGIIRIMRSVVLTNHMSWHAQVNIIFLLTLCRCILVQFTLGLRIYVPMYMYIRLFEQVEEKMLPSSLHFFSTLPQVLCSVIDVQRVIEFVATCFLCRGQDDERYISLISERKGKFMDATGT